MTTNQERWKDIPGWEGLYQASTLGRVRSLDRDVESHRGQKPIHYFKPGRILIPSSYTRGYLRVQFPAQKGEKRKLLLVHRVVALTFIPNPENKRTVNHKDGNVRNNTISNLEWATYSENHQHSFRKLGRRSPNERAVNQLTLDGTLIQTFSSHREAATSIGLRFPANIWSCCNGLRKVCYGFKWEYASKTSTTQS